MPERYYENKELWGRTGLTVAQRQAVAALKRLCTRSKARRIADLGCGDGVVLKALSSEIGGLECYGVDFSTEALRHIEGPLKPVKADISRLPFDDGYFDLSFSIDVFEHVQPGRLEGALAEIHRITRGPVLIVTPYRESDAIRTVCPGCGCIFSPYRHLNRFTLQRWEGLLSRTVGRRNICFVPLGPPKADIPEGLGPLLFAADIFASHGHKTVCPQCSMAFSRTETASFPSLSALLSSYAFKNAGAFGSISEEMGVLTLPEEMSDHEEGEGIWVRRAEESGPSFLIASVCDIDFGEAASVSPGCDLFRSPAYVMDNGALQRGKDAHGILWRVDEENAASRSLKLVFPPLEGMETVRLGLSIEAECDGVLKASQYALPPMGPQEVFEKKVAAFARDEAGITLRFEEALTTPYGLFIDLVWEPVVKGGGIRLYSLKEAGRQREFSLKEGHNPWPVDILPGLHYSISFSPGNGAGIRYCLNGRVFDLSSYMDGPGERVSLALTGPKEDPSESGAAGGAGGAGWSGAAKALEALLERLKAAEMLPAKRPEKNGGASENGAAVKEEAQTEKVRAR